MDHRYGCGCGCEVNPSIERELRWLYKLQQPLITPQEMVREWRKPYVTSLLASHKPKVTVQWMIELRTNAVAEAMHAMMPCLWCGKQHSGACSARD